MIQIFDEILGNALALVKIILYYVVESAIFGLVFNILWMYLFKSFFEIDISYFHFVGGLLIYRLLFFDMANFNKQQQMQYVQEIDYEDENS